MLGKTYDSEVCSMARALEIVGERWSLLILRDALFAGSSRFGEFQRTLGIATNVLSARLEGFVAAGLMERRAGADQAGAPEYVVTAKGRDLVPAIVALTQWGDRWAAPDGPPIEYQHATCGEPVTSQLHCAECGVVDDPAEVQARPGAGMPAEFLAHRRALRRR
ncbi:helix-turn-helix domain-containing protein [Intrasporangium sp.]|uniref:winged helix-turn-helix transcriptional regulator n=1 Tax=Intrasporangium sp. TaxID=1925024 RepID=UPI00293B33AF|nr:helix-turn-helix domain-containing protein [Intrasporangium sp.]MDV3221286.1 helix-turn-helix transcriptional regulator [Intrasporangium sp.]